MGMLTTEAKASEGTPPERSDAAGWWTEAIFDDQARARVKVPRQRLPVGLLPGEGIGREVTDAARQVLSAVEGRFGFRFDHREGGAIGLDSERQCGQALSDEVVAWSREIFDGGGAVLAGPGGGRFVYDLRIRFGLFCKINPIKPMGELDDVSRVRGGGGNAVDILVLRENVNGIYQGVAHEREQEGERIFEYTFRHTESEVRRFLEVSAALAVGRQGRLAVVYKDSGLPELARLWRGVGEEVAAETGVECRFIDIDYACYLMVQEPWIFDVVASSNCFGDILSDMGGLLLGGRGLTFGASYASGGEAFYQTNHGAAYDLKGTGKANPLGHIFSLAMMLRESFGLGDAASAIEGAIRQVLGRGFRSADIAAEGSTVVSTGAMADLLCEAIESGQPPAATQ